MRILNVRLGFAANSSSTHSFVFVKDARDEGIDEQEYGWGHWTAASQEAKLGWLGHVVKDNLAHSLGHSTAAVVAGLLVQGDMHPDGYVDHQSVPILPREWDGKGLQLDFLKELQEYLLRDGLAILGGNDNDDEEHPLRGPSPGLLPFLDNTMGSGNTALVARKDGPVWTLFHRGTGAKVRLTFEGDAFTPCLDSWRPTTPELIDIKITDWCAEACAYCYQGSTTKGEHGSQDAIHLLPYHLGEAHVFEAALGGGEPTVYPKFHELLQAFRYNGIVPNFTTRRLAWLKGPHADAIIESMGTFGYSVDYEHQVRELHEAVVRANVPRDKRPTVHYVVGSGGSSGFMRVIHTCQVLGLDLTLLGYKEIGRGEGQKQAIDFDWLSAVQEAGFDGIRIDTALALQYRERLQAADIPSVLYTTEEGRFSWYLDAVKGMMGPSSYCHPSEMMSVDVKDMVKGVLDAFTRWQPA